MDSLPPLPDEYVNYLKRLNSSAVPGIEAIFTKKERGTSRLLNTPDQGTIWFSTRLYLLGFFFPLPYAVFIILLEKAIIGRQSGWCWHRSPFMVPGTIDIFPSS
jgi:hypothetical protein